MKYIYQACYIFLFTLMGEALAHLIPFPIPAAIWGLLLMFIALCTNILKEEMIRESARWLVAILPFLFVAPTVNLMDSADMLLPDLLPVLVIIPVTSLITFLVSGKTVQRFMIKEEGRDKYE